MARMFFLCIKNFKSIADWCRTESRPFFVEAQTYRYKGHSMSDPRKYRTKEEEANEEDLDCIDARLEKFLWKSMMLHLMASNK